MSKISISLEQPTDDLSAIKLVRELTGISIASVRSRLKQGSRGIIYTTQLFLNDHVERDREIRKIVCDMEAAGYRLFVMELSDDQSWDDVDDFDAYRISTTELISLLGNCEKYE